MSTVIDVLISGLSVGAIYAMIALGYTMVYGIAKMLNFAHGDVIMVGAYVSFIFTQKIIKNPFVAILVAVAFCAILGVIIEGLAYKPLRGVASLAVLITAIGVSFLLQGLAQLLFTVTPQPVDWFKLSSVYPFGIKIKVESIIILAVGIVIMIALSLFVNKSKMGRAMLAVSEDRGAAQLMGVNVNRTIAVTFAIGSALAAIASACMLFSNPYATTDFGAMPGIKAFVAAVLGGIGSIPGAAVGGLILGVIEAIAQKIPFLQGYTDAVSFTILIVVLLVRPSGLLGKKRREKV